MRQPLPSEKRRFLWSEIAYAARYGRQPISEILQLSRSECSMFIEELQSIVERENTVPGGEEHG